MQYAKKFKRGLKVLLHAPLKKNLQMFCFPRTMNWIDLDWSCVHVTSFYSTIMNMYTQIIHAVAIYGNTRANKNYGRNTEGNHTTILQLTTSEKASQMPNGMCIIGQPKFLEDFGIKLHHWVWPKTWLHTNFWVPTTSLYHNTRASKQAILYQ